MCVCVIYMNKISESYFFLIYSLVMFGLYCFSFLSLIIDYYDRLCTFVCSVFLKIVKSLHVEHCLTASNLAWSNYVTAASALCFRANIFNLAQCALYIYI